MMNDMRFVLVAMVFLMGLAACAGPARRSAAVDPAARVQELLDTSIDRGLNRLGRPGGYGKDPAARVDLPEELARAEKTLRRFGLERHLDELQSGLNHAAEAVMPPAKTLLRQAVPACFTPDPALLAAGPDAITRRVRAQCDGLLLERLKPLVTEVMRQQSVAAPYRRLSKRLAAVERSHDLSRLDLEAWLARAVLNGIYVALADEERRARRALSGP